MNRVVITGMGVVSPVGNDVSSFWESLKAGKNGIGPITKFDLDGFKVKVAGEVRDFDPHDYMEKLDVMHSDLYAQFAMAAFFQQIIQPFFNGFPFHGIHLPYSFEPVNRSGKTIGFFTGSVTRKKALFLVQAMAFL